LKKYYDSLLGYTRHSIIYSHMGKLPTISTKTFHFWVQEDISFSIK